MANQPWKESMKSFRRHIDPEIDERLKWTKIGNYHTTPEQPLSLQSYQRLWDNCVANNRMQIRARPPIPLPPPQLYPQHGTFPYTELERLRKTENKLKKSLKLVKSINQNKEGNAKKKTELTHLIEEISNEYQSMYTLYDSLSSEVRRVIDGETETDPAGGGSSSSSSSSTASNYSSASNSDLEFHSPKKGPTPKGLDKDEDQEMAKQKESSDSEDALLKDKLTSTSEIKKAPSVEELSLTNEVPESAAVSKDAEIQDEQLLSMKEQLLAREEKHQAFADQKLAEIRVLEDKMKSMEVELSSISMRKKELEDQVTQNREENSGLKVRLAELEEQFKHKENQLSNLIKKLEEDKKGLHEQNNALREDLEFVSRQKAELDSMVKAKAQEVSECQLHMEKLRDELASSSFGEEEEVIIDGSLSPQVKVEDLKMEISMLSSQKKELEIQIISITTEAYNLRVENERHHARIFVLETTLNEKENESSSLREKMEIQSREMRNLRQELQTLEKQLKQEKQKSSQNLTHTEKKNVELTNKIADQQKSLTGLEHVVNKLTEEYKQVQSRLGETKSTYQIAEKKIEEMAEEFFKKCEDQVRILSRRIRVAEQLHVENKEWYLKTKDRYEQQNKEFKEGVEKNEIWLRNIKDISVAANNTLSAVDSFAYKFEGCTANFQNRISKVSCELKFAKDWIKRKNKAISHVRDDLNCLLAALDDKESEILVYREKVWKSENRMREMEKLMDEKEEGMLALQEEKREAIRQLCVWIDYHRSHSDYYKKILSDMNVAMKKAR